LRRGRTTVVCTASPLWLHHADEVVLMSEHGVLARGSHEELLATCPDYGAVVNRAMDEEEVPS
jgi:ABC-type multidrug transport system fused ATPase/permease subunit